MALHCLCGGTLWRFGLHWSNGKLTLERYRCTKCAAEYTKEVERGK